MDLVVAGTGFLIIWIIMLFVWFAVTFEDQFAGTVESEPSGALFILSGCVGLLVYYVFLEGGRTGQTVGKYTFGIRVVSMRTGGPIGYSNALGRSLARPFISGAMFLLGFLWMLWDKEEQTWHDKISDTVVVPVSAYPTQPTPTELAWPGGFSRERYQPGAVRTPGQTDRSSGGAPVETLVMWLGSLRSRSGPRVEIPAMWLGSLLGVALGAWLGAVIGEAASAGWANPGEAHDWVVLLSTFIGGSGVMLLVWTALRLIHAPLAAPSALICALLMVVLVHLTGTGQRSAVTTVMATFVSALATHVLVDRLGVKKTMTFGLAGALLLILVTTIIEPLVTESRIPNHAATAPTETTPNPRGARIARETGWRMEMHIELMSAAVAEEAYATQNGGKYTAVFDNLVAEGYSGNADVTIDLSNTAEGATTFCLEAMHPRLPQEIWSYNSDYGEPLEGAC